VRRNWLASLALLLALLGLVGGIGAGALWDPHEVSVAELGRRIALNLLGGSGLGVPGADNSVPIRADLGRGELPFTSVAFGFRLLGLSDWAGRLPLALWALAGISAIYSLLVRFWDRRAGLYAALVLSTMPLYFLQARTLLGDAATLASFAIAWSGLTAALFAPSLSSRARVAFTALGGLGLYAGFWCRGPIVSVAVPALAVAFTARLIAPATAWRRALAHGVSLIGVLALVAGVLGMSLASKTGEYSVWVGNALATSSQLFTFDVPLGQLLHAAFPWSAAAPLALALVGARAPEAGPRQAVVVSAALALGLGLAASSWLGSTVGVHVLPAASCYAVLLGAAFVEVEERRLGGPLLGLSVAALALLIGLDLRHFPNKALVGLGLGDIELPESLHDSSGWLWAGGGLALGVAAALCLYEQEPEPGAGPPLPAFQRAEYSGLLTTLQQTWRGNLVLAALVVEAALVGSLLLTAVSERVSVLPQLASFGAFSRKLVAGAAVLVPLLALLPLGALALRDAARLVFRPRLGLSLTRAEAILLVGAAIGGVASLGFYPALSRQVAPKQIIERYRELGRAAEPLGMLGSDSAAIRYRGASGASTFAEPRRAFEWLTRDPAQRRWLLLRRADLPELNAAFRALRGENLPILDARSSEVLLASNRRRPGEPDESPLKGLIHDQPPPLQHPLHAVLGQELEVLGWSLTSPAGKPIASLTPSQTARLTIYYRVRAPIGGAWQSFVHLDGLQRRFNADHELLDGKYPLELWRPGDVLADTTELNLEPHFSPGSYRLYFGLFAGDRRLPVTEGAASDDRIEAGTLQVR
jgi:Dolichyl-phosphate-mannose-protein mannosyltransferase